MSITSVSALVNAIKQSKLLEGNQLQELDTLQRTATEPKLLMRDLIQREWLTPFQANQLFQGAGASLVLGPYVIMSRTGDGPLGQVFKARHRRMNRLVSLKVIRAELLAKPEAVERFYQESQIISQLSEPHIVHAYDAGPMGETHFLAMEYVEGVDLEALVQQAGPLPLAVAIDFVIQIAHGLQHAFERNIPHLDLKPANVLVSRATSSPAGSLSWRSLLASASGGGASVKINDFGLTFLQASDPAQVASAKEAPDFTAPERAQPGCKPDIRSDLYSLGGIFYFALSGRVPFPGGTAAEKLRRHRTEEPARLTDLRKDVPAHIVQVIGKLMAKRLEQRYQTPADVLQALGAGKPARK